VPSVPAARRIHGVIDRHSGEVYNPDKRRAGRSDFSLRPVVSSFLVTILRPRHLLLI